MIHNPHAVVPPGKEDCATSMACPHTVFKAHRLLFHSTLGLRVIKKKKTPDFKNSVVPPGKLDCATSMACRES